MDILKRIPVVRAFYRYWRELVRPAPLQEFNDYDVYWQQRMREGKRAHVLDRHRIISKLVPAGASVLDIGCGDGAFLRFMRESHPASRMLGADISETAITALREARIDGLRIDPALSLKSQIDGHWDCIVLMEVIEHVADAEQLLQQVLELNPRTIFVTIPNVGFLMHRLRLMIGGRFPITSIFYHMKEHVRFWTIKDMHQWAESLGMKVRSYHGQVDRSDKIVTILSRRFPGLFADRMVYELEPCLESRNRKKP